MEGAHGVTQRTLVVIILAGNILAGNTGCHHAGGETARFQTQTPRHRCDTFLAPVQAAPPRCTFHNTHCRRGSTHTTSNRTPSARVQALHCKHGNWSNQTPARMRARPRDGASSFPVCYHHTQQMSLLEVLLGAVLRPVMAASRWVWAEDMCTRCQQPVPGCICPEGPAPDSTHCELCSEPLWCPWGLPMGYTCDCFVTDGGVWPEDF